MKKSDRLAEYIAALDVGEGSTLPEAYLGYFVCFNRQEYYEAHDVLEHLWLQGAGDNYAFFKGLIQYAGAFVHLQKQHRRPEHPKDGRRLHPAVRLFRLAVGNLRVYPALHWQLEVASLREEAHRWAEQIEADAFARNPWSPETAPTLRLLPA